LTFVKLLPPGELNEYKLGAVRFFQPKELKSVSAEMIYF